MLRLELPYPPSLNHYFRNVRGRVLISRRGRAFRARVWWLVRRMNPQPLSGPLVVVVDAFPPDRRRRDADNLQKPVLDALQHARVYHDDCQILRLYTRMRSIVPDGRLVVSIETLRPQTEILVPWLVEGPPDEPAQTRAA